MSRCTFKFRLVPTRKQTELLSWTLSRCRELYNASLQHRRDAYCMAGKSVNYYDQANSLVEVKEVRPEYRDIHSQILQDVLRRTDKAFQAFFRRVKAGEEPGYPRFRGKGRYDSMMYSQYGNGAILSENTMHLSKVGAMKVVFHRPLEGTPKTVCVKRSSTGKRVSGMWLYLVNGNQQHCLFLPNRLV